MISKNFRVLMNLGVCLLFCGVPVVVEAKDKSNNNIPVLHYAGVIPAQWDKDSDWADLNLVERSLSRDFAEAVRSANRFVVLNDELVKSNWSTVAGRKELEAEYELQVFAALNVSSRGDMVVLTSRLLSPTFDTWLQESDVIPRSWLVEASKEQTVAKLGDLIHRMINRLPLDAHITSVNGNFVTISAGTVQSISVGEEFDVISSKLQSLHPANGSWLTYTNSVAGRVKIIEAKGKSSIAKISSMSHDNSIAVGQGILIESISGRARFARKEPSGTFANAHSKDGNAIVPAMNADGSAAAAPIPQTTPTTVDSARPAVAQQTPEAAPAAATGAENPTKASEESGALSILAPAGSDLEAYAGLKSWSIGGSGAASTALPLWLVNSVGASVRRPLSDAIVLGYGLDLGYGRTSSGSFFAYGIHGSGVYVMDLKLFSGADKVFGGLEADIRTISVGGETSGGYDLTTLNLIGGMSGFTDSSLIGTKLDWNAALRFGLQESGRFGVKGNMRNVTGGRGMLLRFLGYIGDRPKDAMQYGGGFEFGSSNYSLANSNSATYNIISLLGLARWNM
jgi:hypothetical protein